MKTVLINISFLIFLSVNVQAQNKNILIQITTNDSAAVVYSNGKFIGHGTIVKFYSKAGIHIIEINKSARQWGSNIIVDTLFLDSTKSIIKLKYKFPRTTLITSVPQGAYIFKNDSLLSYTPAYLPIELGEVKITKPNYENKSLDLKSPFPRTSVKLNFLGKQQRFNFVQSKWFKILLGTAVIFGSVAAHYKLEADKKYTAYLQNRNSNLLNQTNRYDLISGVALGILEVNFGVLLYLLLK